MNLTEPPAPVAVNFGNGALTAATAVLAEKLVTPGLGFTGFLAVIAAKRNLPFWFAGMVKVLSVAPVITEHPEGIVVESATIRVVHEYHLVSKVATGSASQVPRFATNPEPTLISLGTVKIVGVEAIGAVLAASVADAGRLASGNCPKNKVSRASRAVTNRFVTRIVPPNI